MRVLKRSYYYGTHLENFVKSLTCIKIRPESIKHRFGRGFGILSGSTMMHFYLRHIRVLLYLAAVCSLGLWPSFIRAQCSSVTPVFTLDLSGAPNATSVTPSTVRN